MYKEHYIEINQLCEGLYIHLDLSWMNHPFTRSNFKVNNTEQIEKIKQIGLKQLRYDPNRSDCQPLPLQTEPEAATETVKEAITEAANKTVAAAEKASEAEIKQARYQQMKTAINESEKKFVAFSSIVKDINYNIFTAPQSGVEQASTLVNDMVDTAMLESDIVVHAMNGTRSSDDDYQHSLNVTVLSLMLGKSVSISHEEMQLLGISAMLHDIGKTQLKDTEKDSDASKQEGLHCIYGAQIIHKLGLPARVGRALLQHHECWDGSGIPSQLKGDQIDPLASILFICNLYDHYCNPTHITDAKTPYETLRLMFTQYRNKFNDELLKRFIKSLGVYPPGSIVKLSDGNHGTVISVNPNMPLRPYVQLPDDIALDYPNIINLEDETGLTITNCLNSQQLTPQLRQSLKPRKRVNYFIDKSPSEA